MAQRVGIGRLQHRAAIAVDHDRRKRRVVAFGAGVMVMRVNAMMTARDGGIAVDGESRGDRGQAQQATTKPVAGSDTHPCHCAPRP